MYSDNISQSSDNLRLHITLSKFIKATNCSKNSYFSIDYSGTGAPAPVGLNIHKGKSRILRYNTECTNPITIDGEDSEDVKTFTYLGSIIDEHGGSDADVKARIGKAGAVYLHLRNIWNSKQSSTNTKAPIDSNGSKKLIRILLMSCLPNMLNPQYTHLVLMKGLNTTDREKVLSWKDLLLNCISLDQPLRNYLPLFYYGLINRILVNNSLRF
ncbi:unnamed protein product [Schistosoma margrebowiei]|uniref:Uncharacterized protein n=1 Tax=Schistosoma margrebowiei TaxID=48269 RepID=A0A183MQY5_9TREM|nr:unnamed protein product [Schistosoma margrebowiei]